MAGVTKVHPSTVELNWEQVGKDVTFFTVDYVDDISSETGPEDLIAQAYHAIQTRCTIIAAGPLLDTGSQQTFGVEGVIPSDQLTAIENDIKAAGHNASTTVTETKLGILTTAAVS